MTSNIRTLFELSSIALSFKSNAMTMVTIFVTLGIVLRVLKLVKARSPLPNIVSSEQQNNYLRPLFVVSFPWIY